MFLPTGFSKTSLTEDLLRDIKWIWVNNARCSKKIHVGMSENGVYPQWNSYLVGIMISKTIGKMGYTTFSDKPMWWGTTQPSEVFLLNRPNLDWPRWPWHAKGWRSCTKWAIHVPKPNLLPICIHLPYLTADFIQFLCSLECICLIESSSSKHSIHRWILERWCIAIPKKIETNR